MNGLKIITATPVVGELEPKPNIEVKFKSVFLDENMNAQIEITTSLDGINIQSGYIDNVVKQSVPTYDLTPIYDIVKAALEAKGLQVEGL